MKADFDMCEASTECQSGRCINGRCTSSEIDITNQRSMNIMIVLVLLMLIIVITTCYYAKVKNDQLENYYRRHRSDRDTNSDSAGRLEEHRRHGDRRHRRRHRSGSSSSDRLRSRQVDRDLSGSDPSDAFLGQQTKFGGRRLSDTRKDRNRSGDLNRENLDRLSRQVDPLSGGRHEA